MVKQTPFTIPEPFLKGVGSLLDTLVEKVQPPAWLANEAVQRMVLLVNHVLMQEPAATERLERQAGKTIAARWRQFDLQVRVTRAGLFEALPIASASADPASVPSPVADLTITLQDQQLSPVLGALARGDKPALAIVGDVQLAAEINWVADHVRWDIEEDLARIMGDVPAHNLVAMLKTAWSKRPQ